jgi:hypothetical protein
MGSMKNFASEVSCALGFGGELYPEGQGERVMEVASRAASRVAKLLPKEKWRSEDQEFVDLVSRIDHELMDDPEY